MKRATSSGRDRAPVGTGKFRYLPAGSGRLRVLVAVCVTIFFFCRPDYKQRLVLSRLLHFEPVFRPYYLDA